MISRRCLLCVGAALGSGLAVGPLGAEAIVNDDGLYTQPWFLESFLILGEDLEAATAKGKRFAIVWELKGCPYCKATHLVNFADRTIESFVKDRFEILQLNIVGSREVTDFDGEKLSEKRLAEKYGVRFTPVFQFFPEEAAAIAAKTPRQREVARGQGYLEPSKFKRMFAYVVERGYERGSLEDYLGAKG